jgi:omega-hydroxy-beta-dihydromenaquinone-9 sulfotransferase
MTFGAWWSLLKRHGFRVEPARVVLALTVSIISIVNSVLSGYCILTRGYWIRKARPHGQPWIIVGHNRSGTTLLHELMCTDSRWGYPDTYQCFCPSHWLVSRFYIKGLLGFFLPAKRPGDGMKVGFDRPQEDEFALMNLGSGSPYEIMAFPKDGMLPEMNPDLESCSGKMRGEWKQKFTDFLRDLAIKDQRPPLLKSPVHMARVRAILECFPEAKFVHIRRNPYEVIESMLRFTREINAAQAFQSDPDDLLGRILNDYRALFSVWERDRGLLTEGQCHEMSYEDLVAGPVEELEKLYAFFGLDGFDPENRALQRYVREMRHFRPVDRLSLSPEARVAVEVVVGKRAAHWGYKPPQPGPLGDNRSELECGIGADGSDCEK